MGKCTGRNDLIQTNDQFRVQKLSGGGRCRIDVEREGCGGLHPIHVDGSSGTMCQYTFEDRP